MDNVLLLLQHGADPEAVTKDGYSPLHIAAKEGHEDVIGVLIDQSASPNSVTKVSRRVQSVTSAETEIEFVCGFCSE